MINYENEIIAALTGDTPKKKYESLMNMIELIDTFKDDNSNNSELVKVPKFFIDSWKKEEQIWIEQVADLKGKLQTALNVLKSIEWQQEPYVDNIRPFLKAAITTIEKNA